MLRWRGVIGKDWVVRVVLMNSLLEVISGVWCVGCGIVWWYGWLVGYWIVMGQDRTIGIANQ